MKKGFTLAEVLITLGIIGVVAALTIPQLVKNMNDYAFTKSKEVTLAKITEATNQMKSNDVLDGYATTETFADEFQKYLKVSKRCTAANLTDCFAPNFTSTGGKAIATNTLITGDSLGQSTYTSPTVAFGLANGTTILFAFNPACLRIETTDNQASTTSCLAMIYDTNGNSKPNKIGKDIGAINVNFCTTLGSICVADGDITIEPINTCNGSTDISYDPQGSANAGCANNYWAAAKKKCASMGMRLPTGGSGANELNTMYINRLSINISLTNWYWSNDEYSAHHGWCQSFSSSGQGGCAKFGDIIKARCVK